MHRHLWVIMFSKGFGYDQILPLSISTRKYSPTGRGDSLTGMCHHYPAGTANSQSLPLHEQVSSNPIEDPVCLCVHVCARV